MITKFVLIASVGLAGLVLVMPPSAFSQTKSKKADPIAQGKTIAFARSKGNCLACHVIEGGSLAGNIGPELKDIREKYSDKTELRAIIWDSTRNNPNTMMPPFGRNRILTEKEIDLVLAFVQSL